MFGHYKDLLIPWIIFFFFFFPGDVKLPVVLIIYSPSQASHIKSVVALTEYLRNHCFVEALLDQLDIPDSETKVWCEKCMALNMLIGEWFST